jgi:hypothetical protein
MVMTTQTHSKIITTAILAAPSGWFFHADIERKVQMGRDAYLAQCATRWDYFAAHQHSIWVRFIGKRNL